MRRDPSVPTRPTLFRAGTPGLALLLTIALALAADARSPSEPDEPVTGESLRLPAITPVVITIPLDGGIRVDGTEVGSGADGGVARGTATPDEARLEESRRADPLAARLEAVTSRYTGFDGTLTLPVRIRCDARVPFGRLSSVLRTCEHAGIQRPLIEVRVGESEGAIGVALESPGFPEEPGSRVRVRIQPDGIARALDREIALESLPDFAAARIPENPGATWIVAPSPETPHAMLVEALDRLARVGIPQIAIGLPTDDRGTLSAAGTDRGRGRPISREVDPRSGRAMVDAGLAWLARQQRPDGSWDSKAGGGYPLHDVGLTGLAMLAFVEDGSTHEEGRYRQNVAKAALWLRKQMDPEGCIGPRTAQTFTYSHAIATAAFAELYAKTRSPLFKPVAQKALGFAEHCRNPHRAWRYGIRPGEDDTSVTSWMLAALIAGKRGGLEVDTAALDGGKDWIDSVTGPDGRVGYNRVGIGPVRPVGREEDFPAALSESLTAAGAWCRLALGEEPVEDSRLALGLERVRDTPPSRRRGARDYYYWYYGARAMNASTEPGRSEWRNALVTTLAESQETEGPAAGSWPIDSAWGAEGGRVYTTAMSTRALLALLPPD